MVQPYFGHVSERTETWPGFNTTIKVELNSVSAVEKVLLSDAAVPPNPHDSFAPGATLNLRQDMARFSMPDRHQQRRARVDALIASIDRFGFAAEARSRTEVALERIQAGDVDNDALSNLAYVVPVEVLALALGADESSAVEARHDTHQIAVVIGRREPSTVESDAAASRLLSLRGSGPDDPVATVSLLYQTYDATAALFAATLISLATGKRRCGAVLSTLRVARQSMKLGNAQLAPGTVLSLDLEGTGFEFGFGAHACPGRSIAERIVGGMIEAIKSSGLQLDVPAISQTDDGTPGLVPLIDDKQGRER